MKQRQYAEDPILAWLAPADIVQDLLNIGSEIGVVSMAARGRPVVPPVYWNSATSSRGSMTTEFWRPPLAKQCLEGQHAAAPSSRGLGDVTPPETAGTSRA